jgi:Polysaccharide pyruvyl transferase
MQTGLYIGWTGYGNLGDEAMLEVCRTRFVEFDWITFESWDARPKPYDFARRAFRSPTVLFDSLVDEIRTGRRVHGFLKGLNGGANARGSQPVALLGGGTLINANDEFLEQYRRAHDRLQKPVPVFGCGVKTPDFFAGKGAWRDRTREWVELTRDLPVIGVRGPLSKQALDAAGAHNVCISGDPAVWFHQPLPTTERVHTWRPLRIGVNCGSAKFIWGDLSRLVTVQADVVCKLLARGYEVELFAICPEDMAACEEVARQANAGVSPIPEALSSHYSYASRLADLDLVITLKLHAAVLAACANVPFIMLEYQPKCRDFCASIDWEDYNVRTDNADSNTIMSLAERLLHDLPASRRMLCLRMGELRTSFESYCRELEQLLPRAIPMSQSCEPTSRPRAQ